MNYNFDFKVGTGDTLKRINLAARYHGVRYWTYPERLSFWHPELVKLDLFVFSYWSVMRDTLSFHVDYWFEKVFKRYDEVTIELRQLGRFNTIRETELTEIVPIDKYRERKLYWDEKLLAFEYWKVKQREIIPSISIESTVVKSSTNAIGKQAETNRSVKEIKYRCDVNSVRLFYLFVLICQSSTINWFPLFRFTWFRVIDYQKEYFPRDFSHSNELG